MQYLQASFIMLKLKFGKFRYKKKSNKVQIWRLLPNAVTLLALCLGITSILLGHKGNFAGALILILVASLLDALDGRLARALSASSQMGAELDSLCDFMNFGVAPGIFIYFWSLEQSIAGDLEHQLFPIWCAILMYCSCMAIRLARFNITPNDDFSKKFFLGIPAPCCAILVLSPIMLDLKIQFMSKELIFAYLGYILLISFLCVSTVPTICIKHISVHKKHLKIFLFCITLISLTIIAYLWYALPILSLLYILTIPITAYKAKMYKKEHAQPDEDKHVVNNQNTIS